MVPGSGSVVAFFVLAWGYVGWSFWWAGSHGLAMPIGLPLSGLASLAGWRMRRPGSFARWVSRPWIARWRHLLVYGRVWEAAMVACRVAARPGTETEQIPRLLRVRRTATGDVLTVAMLRGQTVAQWVACAERLAQAFDAPACRVTAVPGRPQRLHLSFPVRDALGVVVAPLPAVPLDALDLEAVPVARAEDGTTYAMPVLYAHTLIAGETGAGKGSVLWSVLAGLGPAIRAGLVQVWAIDPKGGMELGAGAGLFARFAYGAPVPATEGAEAKAGKAAPAWQEDMAALLELAVQVMQARAAHLRGVSRKHVPTVAEPLVLVVVDELAALTAYVTDAAIKKRLAAALGLLLSQGRAVGVSVIGATQDARKETLGMRDLFSRRVALRTAEAEMGDLILGSGHRARGFRTDQISAATPGVAYVAADEAPDPVRVRFSYLTDADIAALAQRYRPAHPEPLIVVPPPTVVDVVGDAAPERSASSAQT